MKFLNLVLIGMPSSGKTSVGQIIASQLKLAFVDTDDLLLEKTQMPLKDFVDIHGREYFLKLQEDIVSSMNVENHVIATGGSVIYGAISMQRLKENGLIVYLKSSEIEIANRLTNGRRFAKNKDQNLHDLYIERVPLYEKFADHVIDCNDKKVEEISIEVLKLIKK